MPILYLHAIKICVKGLIKILVCHRLKTKKTTHQTSFSNFLKTQKKPKWATKKSENFFSFFPFIPSYLYIMYIIPIASAILYSIYI